MYVIGIDGGGTKTKGVIASASGEIVSEAIVGATNPNNVSKTNLQNEIQNLIDALRKQNPDLFEQVSRVYAGMSGVDHPTAREEVRALIASIVPSTMSVTVNNDAITALYSGTLGKPGIVQIAGTGSITFGLNEEGVFDRVGGWGYLVGESGSGYGIGSAGLQAAFSAHDGLGKQTLLSGLIKEQFNIKALPDLIHTIYTASNPKELIASLTKLVVQAADQDDFIAKKIIRSNAEYIADCITCLIKKIFVNMECVTIPVVVTGGVFNRLDLLQGHIEESFRNNDINAILIKPKIEPVGGAVIAALLEENIFVSEEFLDTFSSK